MTRRTSPRFTGHPSSANSWEHDMAAGSAAGQHPAASHPGNDYYVQPSTGTIRRQSNPVAAGLLQAAGFQGPMTWDQAQTVIGLNKKVAQTGAAPITGTAGEAATGQAGSLPNPLAGIAGAYLWIVPGVTGKALAIKSAVA